MRLASGLPQQATEPARIIEAQQAAVFQADIHVIVRTHRCIAGQHTQAAGHAQVQHRTARFGIQQQVLGAATDRFDALTRQLLFDLGGNRPAQVRSAQDHAVDAAIHQMGFQAAPGSFYFG